MFTGIIRDLGTITARDGDDEQRELTIATDLSGELREGDSVAVNGACLTVLAADEERWYARLMAETLSRTNLGSLEVNDLVNLERPLSADGRIDGHFVQGHVDGTTEVRDIHQQGGDFLFTFALPKDLAPYVAPKGSIALDGVSLTVVDVTDEAFSISVMPYTYEHTTFGLLKVGSAVNVEVDILAKYVVRLQQR